MKSKILIFGATGAVGSSLAKLMRNGSGSCHLIGKNEEEVKGLAEETGHTFSVADVLEDNFVEKIEQEVNEFEISGIAYCIGSIDLKPLNLVSKKDVMKCFSLNLFPIYDIVKKFQPSLKKNKGSIVLFSTVAVKQGFPNHSIISPAKASLEGLTVSLASELSPSIRGNCIAPSMSNSKMANKILKNPKIAEGIAKQHPLKRVGEGKDSAALAKFLLSEESSWITGQIIGVDGGRSNIG